MLTLKQVDNNLDHPSTTNSTIQ